MEFGRPIFFSTMLQEFLCVQNNTTYLQFDGFQKQSQM